MGFRSIKSLWHSDRSYFLLVAAVGVLPWLLSGIAGWFVGSYVIELAKSPSFPWIFFPATALTMALGLTPTTLIATLAGFLFGAKAFPLVVLSYLMAAYLGRWLGIWLNKTFTGTVRFSNQKADQLFMQFEKEPFWLLVFCRLSPVLTFALTNAALGRMTFKTKVFLSATLIGMLPRTALVFYSGTKAAEWDLAIRSGADPTMRIVLFIIFLTVSFAGIAFMAKKAISLITTGKPPNVKTST